MKLLRWRLQTRSTSRGSGAGRTALCCSGKDHHLSRRRRAGGRTRARRILKQSRIISQGLLILTAYVREAGMNLILTIIGIVIWGWAGGDMDTANEGAP